MTKADKSELQWMVKNGYSIKQIQDCIPCCVSTIKRYIRVFGESRSTEVK